MTITWESPVTEVVWESQTAPGITWTTVVGGTGGGTEIPARRLLPNTVGEPGQIPAVNDAGTAVEYVDAPSGTGTEVDYIATDATGAVFDIQRADGSTFTIDTAGAPSGKTIYLVSTDRVFTTTGSGVDAGVLATAGLYVAITDGFQATAVSSASTDGVLTFPVPGGGGSGDVVGPASATTGRPAVFADESGKVIAQGGVNTPDGLLRLNEFGVAPPTTLPSDLVRTSEMTTAITNAMNALLDGAPGALDTLNELAAAVNDDASFAATVTTALAARITDPGGANDALIQRKAGAWTSRTPAQVKADMSIGVGDVSGLDENTRDVIGAALVAGSGVAVTVDDPGNTITIAVSGVVADAINDGTTTVAPSQNAVFDALALKVPTSLVDAKGDLLAGTADNTVARLAVGPNGHYPIADSAQAVGLRYVKKTGSGSPTVSGGHASGDWFLPPERFATGNSSTQSLVAGNLWYCSFTVERPIVITAAAVHCSSIAASSLVRAGIVLLDSVQQPSSLITEFATFDTTATGLKSVTGLTLAVDPGEYATIVKTEGGNPTLAYWPTFHSRAQRVAPTSGGSSSGVMTVSTSAGAYANPPAAWTTYQGTGYCFLYLRWVLA